MSYQDLPDELEFDQTERFTDRLRDLVRSYPKGLGLIKEFLQNADDAGASSLQVIYDRRHHPETTSLGSMKVALNPSLLFVNDETFTDQDFRNIQKLNSGGKLEDAARTGRFGQGFNTCYSVSDSPSLLTGNRIAWFDPHHWLGNISSKGVKNAHAWPLTKAATKWPDWIRTFQVAGLNSDSENFPGTVFRLPLRTPEDAPNSDIIKEAFSQKDFENILEELVSIGPAILVFLRSVLHIEVLEINEKGNHSLRYRLETTNSDEVDSNRIALREFVKGDPAVLLARWAISDVPLPVVQYEHTFKIIRDGIVVADESWAVTMGLFRGKNNILIEQALQVCEHAEKAIPWVGAACRRDSNGPKLPKGGIACFLPIPERTNWPVWLHGWFDLSSDRRGITREPDVGGTTETRFEWNRCLMEYGVSAAWVLLVEQLRPQPTDTMSPYKLWPKSVTSNDEIDRALIDGFYRSVAERNVVRQQNSSGYIWSSIRSEVWNVNKSDIDTLKAPLLAEGWAICNPPLPDFVRKGFHKANVEFRILTPSVLIDYLQELGIEAENYTIESAPFPMLRKREWIYTISRFCSTDGLDNLAWLPLALLGDGKIHTFNECGELFIIDQKSKKLLDPLPGRRLDLEFQSFLGLTESIDALDLRAFDLPALLDCIPEVLSQGTPKIGWLQSVFDFLAASSPTEIDASEVELKELLIVPDQRGKYHAMGKVSTPLIPPPDNQSLWKLLDLIGIPLLQQSSAKLLAAIINFAVTHEGYIYGLTPHDLADNLVLHVARPYLDEVALDTPENLACLLDFLTRENWLTEDDDRISALRKFRLLPSTCGERLAAESDNIYLSSGFRPPREIAGNYKLIYTGESDKWREFFLMLGAKNLDGLRFIQDVLLPAFEGAGPSQIEVYLCWLRDEYRLVARDLSVELRQSLHERIRSSAIIPLGADVLGIPKKTYLPSAHEPRRVLGETARYPDPTFFSRDEDLWNNFFRELELPEIPLTRDIYRALSLLAETAAYECVDAVRDKLTPLVDYTVRNFQRLHDRALPGGRTFSDALRNLEWLPALSPAKSRFAATREWPDKLWRPIDLIPARLGHLAASKYPVLDGQEFASDMAGILGLKTQLAPEDVVSHFQEVMKVNLAHENIDMVRNSANEFVRQVGTLPEHAYVAWKPILSQLAGKSCIFVSSRWWRVEQCYWEVPFPTRRLLSLAGPESRELNESIRTGYRRMGVVDRPNEETLLKLLREIGTAQAEKLSSEDLSDVNHILRYLRGTGWTDSGQFEVWVPLINGRLGRAVEAIVADDPRLKTCEPLHPLPLIEDNDDAIHIGLKAGARSLRCSLVDNLIEQPTSIATDETMQQFERKLRHRLLSKEFRLAVCRILYHDSDDVEREELLPRIPDGLLPAQLRLQLAERIKVRSSVSINGSFVDVFVSEDERSFYDRHNECIWLKKDTRARVADSLVRELCKIVDTKEQLIVRSLLDTEPSEMQNLLDAEKLVMLPGGKSIELPFHSSMHMTEEGSTELVDKKASDEWLNRGDSAAIVNSPEESDSHNQFLKQEEDSEIDKVQAVQPPSIGNGGGVRSVSSTAAGILRDSPSGTTPSRAPNRVDRTTPEHVRAMNSGEKSSNGPVKEADQPGKSGDSSASTARQNVKPEFPVAPVADAKRREQRVAEEYAQAPGKSYTLRERSVRDSKPDIEPKTWLRALYTNESHELVCQICKKEMPFRGRDGKHYFEAVEIFPKELLPKESAPQYVALCPLCSAKYQEFIKKDMARAKELRSRLICGEGGSLEFSIQLGREEASLQFVEKHFVDLKVSFPKF